MLKSLYTVVYFVVILSLCTFPPTHVNAARPSDDVNSIDLQLRHRGLRDGNTQDEGQLINSRRLVSGQQNTQQSWRQAFHFPASSPKHAKTQGRQPGVKKPAAKPSKPPKPQQSSTSRIYKTNNAPKQSKGATSPTQGNSFGGKTKNNDPKSSNKAGRPKSLPPPPTLFPTTFSPAPTQSPTASAAPAPTQSPTVSTTSPAPTLTPTVSTTSPAPASSTPAPSSQTPAPVAPAAPSTISPAPTPATGTTAVPTTTPTITSVPTITGIPTVHPT